MLPSEVGIEGTSPANPGIFCGDGADAFDPEEVKTTSGDGLSGGPIPSKDCDGMDEKLSVLSAVFGGVFILDSDTLDFIGPGVVMSPGTVLKSKFIASEKGIIDICGVDCAGVGLDAEEGAGVDAGFAAGGVGA